MPHLGSDFLRVLQIGSTLLAYLQPQPAMYNSMVAAMNGFNLGTDIILAGIDATGARLAVIGHPGTLAWADKLGHHAVGSGGIHAITRLALGAQTRRGALIETLYRVYEAKKAAEAAPGVGSDTDCDVISLGKTTLCSEKTMKALAAAFTKAKGSTPDNLDAIAEALKADQ